MRRGAFGEQSRSYRAAANADVLHDTLPLILVPGKRTAEALRAVSASGITVYEPAFAHVTKEQRRPLRCIRYRNLICSELAVTHRTGPC